MVEKILQLLLNSFNLVIIVIFLSCAVSKDSNSPSENGLLIISEVGTTFNPGGSAWLEVYNNTREMAQLSDFELITKGYNINTGEWETTHSFSLPELKIYSGSYAIIHGSSLDNYINGQNLVYIKDEDVVPSWTSSGFIELRKTGVTIDFVKFGINDANPLSPASWIGDSAAALPYSILNLGESLTRDGSNVDTDTKEDWSLNKFSTPGGPNDIINTTDNDEDGIPDLNEMAGTTFAGLPLYEWGARIDQKDIFIHVDYMDSTDAGVIPDFSALKKVADVFATHRISVHFDCGDLFDKTAGEINPAMYDLDDGIHRVPFSAGTTIGTSYDGRTNLYSYKNEYMPIARRQIFYYMLFAYSQNINGHAGSSGLAEFRGNDTLITLGNFGLVSFGNIRKNYQAGTVLHELGHNLGLRHGGDEDNNYKPNYISTMNYLYQLNGLPTMGNNEGDRLLFWLWGEGSMYDFINSCYDPIDSFIIDFSDGISSNLDENNLDEISGFGRTESGYIDFNNNDSQDSSVAVDLDNDGTFSTLKDYDDWSNLFLFFSKTKEGSDSGVNIPSFRTVTRSVNNDEQNIYPE